MDEVSALTAIYAGCVSLVGDALCISLREEGCLLRFALPSGYPCCAPPRVDVVVRGNAPLAAHLLRGLDRVVEETAPGEVLLFTYVQWVIEELRAALEVDSKRLSDAESPVELGPEEPAAAQQPAPRHSIATAAAEYDTVEGESSSLLVGASLSAPAVYSLSSDSCALPREEVSLSCCRRARCQRGACGGLDSRPQRRGRSAQLLGVSLRACSTLDR